MATKTVSGYHDEAIAVNASGNTWRLIENATIVSNDFGFSVAVGASNNRFDIAGHIQAGTGINGLAPRMSVDIRDTGSIYAANGISMQGTGRFVADIDGTIGWRLLGHVPVRTRHDGLLPVPGVNQRFLSGTPGQAQLARYQQIRVVKDNGDGSATFELVD